MGANIIIVWALIEVRLILSLPIISSSKGATRAERTLKYFIIQIIRGLSLLTIFIVGGVATAWIEVVLILKLGLAPFFIWVPHVFTGLSYFSLGLLRTILKTPSLTLVRSLPTNFILIVAGGARIMIGSLAGVLCPSIKKILSYSSVAHTGWLAILAAQSVDWVIYLLLYSIIIYWGLSWFNTNLFKSSLQIFYQGGVRQIVTIVVIIRLSGFPPTLGFYLKMLGIVRLIRASVPVALLLVLRLTARVYYYFTLFLHAWLINYKPHNKYNLRIKYGLPIVLVVLISLII